MKPSLTKFNPRSNGPRGSVRPIKRFYLRTKRPESTFLFIFLAILLTGFSSCGWMHNLFGPKYGCPSNGRNVGAERILAGEKVPSAKWKGGN